MRRNALPGGVHWRIAHGRSRCAVLPRLWAAKNPNGRVGELARKSSAGTLSEDEQREYAEIVPMNDLVSALRLQAQDYWSSRAAG